jgi:hypothetical protein
MLLTSIKVEDVTVVAITKYYDKRFVQFQLNENPIENEQRAVYFVSCSTVTSLLLDSKKRNEGPVNHK